MRLFILFFCLLRIAYSSAYGQSIDSIQISLSTKSTDALIFGQTLAIDGLYKIPEENLLYYPTLADFVLVQPAALTGPDKSLRISSQANLAQQSPAYEFRRFPYVEPPIDTTPQPTQSNYADANGILDGVYISEHIPYQQSDTLRLFQRNQSGWKSVWDGYYVKYSSDPSVTDSVTQLLKNDFQNYRTTIAQPLIDELLQPFYISPNEVTNAQYRAFVHWVRDSIAFDLLYRELPENKALALLNCTKKQRATLDEDSLAFYVARYGFNYDYFRDQKVSLYDNEAYLEILKALYYPISERFYKRREFDISKFVYRSATGSPTPVYPDTLCWLRDSPYPEYDPLVNMYFWHPAYNNFPVVGVNEAQMKAYCDWLQRQKNRELKDAPYTIRVELPQLFHYEMATKLCAPVILRNEINAQSEDPFIINRSREDVPWFIVRATPMSDKAIEANKTHSPRLINWYTINQTYPIWYLTGGVSEYCQSSKMTENSGMMTVLGGNRTIGLVDKHENQLNTICYQQQLPADKGSSMVGFRPVIYLEWKE
jgi:hypothetical protein